jgi:hypothetical protein
MSAKNSFLRKIYYIIGIAVLLVLLFELGHPPTRAIESEKSSPGGILAQMREEHNLTQTRLGEVDPTSAAIKLATFGMSGAAVQVLWIKSDDYKMKEDWAKYEATLNQITLVQPHFLSVWVHLAWNLSYNVSVEFDNYRDRYHWVIEGIKYLQRGIDNNNHDPRLLWEEGWTVSQKIGRADEHKQFRKLFKEDDEFHHGGPRAEEFRDNWLVGKKFYDETIAQAAATGKGVKGKGPLIFNSSPAMCLMNYAEAIEEEGTFGDNAQRAWEDASKGWAEFGRKLIPDPDDEQLILGDLEKREGLEKEKSKALDDLDPGLRDRIHKKKYDALTKEQREAYETPVEKRDENQQTLASQAQVQLEITYDEIARQVPLDKRAEAKKLAAEALKNAVIAIDIRRSRDVVNYAYWKLRAEVEQEKDTIEARKNIFDGTRSFRRDAKMADARDEFNKGFIKWRKVLDNHPALIEDSLTGDDLMDVIKVYRELLQRMDEPFPKPFILQDIIDKYDKKG